MQFPGLAVGHFHCGESQTPENLEIDARVAAHVRHSADEEDGHVDAALQQGACDHEAVAAIVAAPAQHRHLMLVKVAMNGFHGRDDLAPRILHEHQRRDADLFDRPAIRFAHLRGIQHSHLSGPSSPCVQCLPCEAAEPAMLLFAGRCPRRSIFSPAESRAHAHVNGIGVHI